MKKQPILTTFFITFLLISFPLCAQETASDLRSLIDMRASNLDYQMENHGYEFVKTEKSGYNSYQNWWNNRKNKCVTVRVSDGKVQSIVNSPSFDCNKSGRNNSNNYSSRSGNAFYDNHNEKPDYNYSRYLYKSATSAYGKLEDDGFHELKTHQENGYTYKLWYKSRTNECLKTVSYNYNLTKILYSHYCDENNNRYSNDYDNDRNRNRNRGDFYNSYDHESDNTNYTTYINKGATTAYRRLEDDGFREIKIFQKDGYTYKLWYKNRTRECIKTVSYDYKLTKILFSHHCDENL